MTGRRRFLDRTRTAQERRAQDRRGFDPAGMIRLAGFGAALIVAAGVYVGFRREDEGAIQGPWGALDRLTQPILFGTSALEMIAIALAGVLALRFWARMTRR